MLPFCSLRDWFHFEEKMNEQVFAEHFVVYFLFFKKYFVDAATISAILKSPHRALKASRSWRFNLFVSLSSPPIFEELRAEIPDCDWLRY